MKLRFNPFQIFEASKSPAGLYARKKWLGESGNASWQDDFSQTVSLLSAGQHADGSWFQSPVETIRRLFGLHLTVREKTADIERALAWLIDETLTEHLTGSQSEAFSDETFRELPFVQAQPSVTLSCAALFLASVFQSEQDDRIAVSRRRLGRWLAGHADSSEFWPEKINILRALIVSDSSAGDSETTALVQAFESIQQPSGLWPAPIDFFLTVNALAHLNTESSHRQWRAALPLLCNVQQKDGSWGRTDHEWNTFLVVHALKNKQAL